MDILATGYFLVSREAFRVMRAQGMGGSIIFVASKNGRAVSPNASAYRTAKAAEERLDHTARLLLTEEVKDLPFAAVRAEFHAREDRPTGQALIGALDRYQASVAGRGWWPFLDPAPPL
mgnify:CR=1 FL=1